LLVVLGDLGRRGIPAVAFKGPMLALMSGDLSSRAFGDLDVLVRSRDVVAAHQTLVERDYRIQPPFALHAQVEYVAHLTGWYLEHYLRSRSEHHFSRWRDRSLIDLHLAFADPSMRVPLGAEDVLARAERIAVDGHSVRVPAPDDLVLILAVNAAKDCWTRLQHLRDVAVLMRSRPDLDWPTVWRRARQFGLRRILEVTLQLVDELLETRPSGQWQPESIRARTLARRAIQDLSRGRQQPANLSVRYAWWMTMCRERARDRAWYYLHLLLVPGVSDWMCLPLHPRLFFLYAFVRPVRLALAHATPVRHLLPARRSSI
jgi:hypothetical protein